MSRTSVIIEHVRLILEKPFEAFSEAFEKQLGHLEEEVDQIVAKVHDPKEVEARIESMLGSSGFFAFQKRNHGALLRLVGEPRKAMQYLVGNPLLAMQMTRHAIGAALHAPIRVLLYETEDGKTCVEYDLPSSVFGQFRDDRIDAVATSLDQKFETIVAEAMR